MSRLDFELKIRTDIIAQGRAFGFGYITIERLMAVVVAPMLNVLHFFEHAVGELGKNAVFDEHHAWMKGAMLPVWTACFRNTILSGRLHADPQGVTRCTPIIPAAKRSEAIKGILAAGYGEVRSIWQ